MDVRVPGVGSVEVEAPVEEVREVRLDQTSKVRPREKWTTCPARPFVFVSVSVFVFFFSTRRVLPAIKNDECHVSYRLIYTV